MSYRRGDSQTAKLSIKRFNIQEMQLNSKVAIIGKPGCFAKDTPVLMASGAVRPVQDILPGNLIMGDDGTMRTVLELRRGFEPMYRITPTRGGDSVTVNETHILVLVDTATDETIEITVADYLALSPASRDTLEWFWHPVKRFHRTPVSVDLTRAWRLGREASTGVIDSIPEVVRLGSYRVRDNFMRGLLAFHPSYSGVGAGNDGDLEVGKELLQDVLFVARSVGYRCKALSESKLRIVFERIEAASSPFVCEPMGDGDYYGFVIDGNHRFLLGDFSVVRNTGKSTLMKDLLYQHRHRFPIGLVLSETNKESGDFKGLVPPLFTYDYYNQQAMDNLVLRQRRMVRQNGEGDVKNFAFVIVDDCMDDTSWVNHKTTKGIFKNGRHWDLFFLLSMQYCLGIPPTLRTCLDYIFILREPMQRNRRNLWINYASIFPTFEMFCDALDDLTQDYHCMVIKNRVLSNKIEDVVFWYKAKRHKPFRVGTNSWWNWAERHYNDRYEEEEEEQRLAAQRGGNDNLLYGQSRRRGGIKLRVRMEP
jgi:hypothetical protein